MTRTKNLIGLTTQNNYIRKYHSQNLVQMAVRHKGSVQGLLKSLKPQPKKSWCFVDIFHKRENREILCVLLP